MSSGTAVLARCFAHDRYWLFFFSRELHLGGARPEEWRPGSNISGDVSAWGVHCGNARGGALMPRRSGLVACCTFPISGSENCQVWGWRHLRRTLHHTTSSRSWVLACMSGVWWSMFPYFVLLTLYTLQFPRGCKYPACSTYLSR